MDFGSENVNDIARKYQDPKTISIAVKIDENEWQWLISLIEKGVKDEIVLGLHPRENNPSSYFMYRSNLVPSRIFHAPFKFIMQNEDIEKTINSIGKDQFGIDIKIEKFMLLFFVTFRYKEKKLDYRILVFKCAPVDGMMPHLKNSDNYSDLQLISLPEYRERLTERIDTLQFGYNHFRYVLSDYFLKTIVEENTINN